MSEDKDPQLERSLALFNAYLNNTPKEEIEKTLKEIGEIGEDGVTVEEYFQGVARDYYAVAKRNNELEAKLSAQEELLRAVEEILKFVPLGSDNGPFSGNIYLNGFNEAVEKYRTLKSKEKLNT